MMNPHPTKFFGNQFPPTTFFPSRPYFWPTFFDHPSFFTQVGGRDSLIEPSHKELADLIGKVNNEITPSTTVGQFFRISRPYLDLGGSGIVVTLTRGLVVDGIAKAVICIDLRFDDNNSVLKSLQTTIGGLNADIFQLDCSIGQGSQRLECKDEKKFDPLEDKLFHQVKNEFTRRSTEILSDLYRFDENTNIRFSLPLNRTINPDGSQSVTLMLASFDPALYKKHSAWIAIGAATSFGLLTAFLTYLWGSIEVNSERYESAFKRVDEVLDDCPTPYTRLNQNDDIIAANKAFVKVFGLPLSALKSDQPNKLRSFCFDDRSLAEYDRVESLRKKDAPVPCYTLVLRGVGGRPVTYEVHSAAIQSTIKNRLPDTFGIFLEIPPQAPPITT